MENTQQASILKLRGLKNKDMFLPIFDTISINSRTNTGGDVFRELWIMIFQMFGVEWVMPKRVVDLLVCWYRGLDEIIVWNAIPSFLFWCIWGEINARSFNDQEKTSMVLQTCLLKTLFEWNFATALPRVSSYADFCSLFSCS